jgi:aerobic-type carbon monoxide dehydrogenase small subunit (CoxS/CutS family)
MDIMEYFIEQHSSIPMVKHPIIQAYINSNASRCGYCTPGFVCTDRALVDRNNRPAEAEVREALDGNLCRYGTLSAAFPCGIGSREEPLGKEEYGR